MKKLFILFALFGVWSIAPVKHSSAQEATIKIAVIDINTILREGKAFQAIRDQISKYRETFQSEIQKEEEALRNANQELARQRTLLSPEAFAEKRQEFEKRVAEAQRLVQQRKVNLDRVQAETMGNIQNILNEIVTNMSQEMDISLILRKDQTILAVKALQITQQVLERLDAQLPTVNVPKPAQ